MESSLLFNLPELLGTGLSLLVWVVLAVLAYSVLYGIWSVVSHLWEQWRG